MKRQRSKHRASNELLSVSQVLPNQLKTQYVYFRFHANYFFYLGRFLKKIEDDQYTSITKGGIYHINHNTFFCIAFYHSGWLTRNYMCKGSIYYVLYLQILRFYLGWQSYDATPFHTKSKSLVKQWTELVFWFIYISVITIYIQRSCQKSIDGSSLYW